MNRTTLTLALTALTLAGCKVQKPSTPIPALPSIDTFTVSRPNAEKGDQVTLTWKTSNATRIELREATTGDLGVPVTTLEGTHNVTVDTDALFVLVARGEGGSDARAISVRVNESSGDAVSLQALPPLIVGGASTTLVWTAPGATTLTLTANGAPVQTGGQLANGAVTVQPVVDTTYVLTVEDRTAQVQVTVQPAVLTLSAAPRAVQSGDPVTVSWTAAGAERVVVSSPGRGQLFEATSAALVATGSFTDTIPALPDDSVVTYVVEAVKGSERFERRVEVNVGTGIAVTRFDAPPVASASGVYQVRWETRAADVVELRLDGATIYRSPNAQFAAAGFFGFTVGADDFAIEVVATNSRGDVARQLAQVDTVGVPTAATLTATPASVAIGQPVTLTWDALEARRVRIVDSAGVAVFSATGQPAEGGSFTVYPSVSTTYQLSADNLLGSPPVSVTAAVTVTGAVPTLTRYPPTPITGQNVSLTTSDPNAIFHGFAHGTVLTSTQSAFRDISATGQRLLELGGDVASVTLPFSTWLFAQQQTGSLTISRAGWMAFGAPQSVLTSEVALPASGAPAFVIAPFWDNLTLVAGSAVYAEVVGAAPNETLIVQWNELQVGTTTSTRVTFQAQVTQRGQVSFHYGTMTPGSSPTFSIGVQDGTRTRAVRSTTVPASNSALYFFSPVAAPVDVRAVRGADYGGFVQVGEVYSFVTQPSGAVTVPLDLALTEFMFRPADAVGFAGQYLEVQNKGTAPLDLTGWELRSPGQPTFYVPQGFLLQPGAPTVIGGSSDPLLNDDAGVTLSWEGTGFHFPQDGGAFTVTTADAGGFGFTYTGPADGGRGYSLNVDPGPIVGTSGSPGLTACAATTVYGFQTPQQLGSPGVIAGCFPYAMSSIPSRYTDVSDAGAVSLHTGTAAEPTPYTVVISDGGSAMPTTFGTPRPVVSMSHDGWLVYGSVTSSNFSNTSNPSTTSVPVGPLAIFWDDLEMVAGASQYYKHFAAGEDPNTPVEHWVFDWSHISQYSASPNDDLNFQIKLFADGVIEYHFGTMTSTGTTNYANGQSATVWLAVPTGANALVLGINQPIIQSNTAYRFTPR